VTPGDLERQPAGTPLAFIQSIGGSDGPLGLRASLEPDIQQDTNLEREGLLTSTKSRTSIDTLKITPELE
jgi:hypothetical protein